MILNCYHLLSLLSLMRDLLLTAGIFFVENIFYYSPEVLGDVTWSHDIHHFVYRDCVNFHIAYLFRKIVKI